MEKQCRRCSSSKNIEEFGIRSDRPEGHSLVCKVCTRTRARESYSNRREDKNAKARLRRQENPDADRRYSAAYRKKFVWRRLITDARKRSKILNLPFDLDEHAEEIKKRVEPMRCELTGLPLVNGVGAGSQGKRFWNTASLDRKNPDEGYIYPNIRVVCWAVNMALGTWGEEILMNVLTAWIQERQNNFLATTE